MARYLVETDQGTYEVEADLPEGAGDEELQRAVSQRIAQPLSVAPTVMMPPGGPEDLRAGPAPQIEEHFPNMGMPRYLPESTGPWQAFGQAAKGEFARIGTGARGIAALAMGDYEKRERLRQMQAALEAEQAERSEDYPKATFLGTAVPHIAATPYIANAALSTLPRAMGTGAGIGAGIEGLAAGAEDPETAATRAALGAAGGAAGGAVGRGLGTMLSRRQVQLNPFQQRSIQDAHKLGFRTTPAQETGARGLERLEKSMESMPMTAGNALRTAQHNADLANQLAARSIGEKGSHIDDLVLGDASRRIGREFQYVANQVKAAPIDDQFMDDMIAVNAPLAGSPIPTDAQKIIPKVMDSILEKAGKDNDLTGKQINTWTSRLRKKASSLMRGEKTDPELADAYYDLAAALDGLLARNAPDLAQARLARAREQWGNLVMLEKPGVVRGGQVSLATLANNLKRYRVQGYRRGGLQGTDTPTARLFAAARFSEASRPSFGTSGTAERLSVPTTVGAAGAGTAITGDLFTGAALGVGGPALLSRLYGRYPFTTGLAGGLIPPGAPGVMGGMGVRAAPAVNLELMRQMQQQPEPQP